MKNIIVSMTFFASLMLFPQAVMGGEYSLLYHSPQVPQSIRAYSIYPKSNLFAVTFHVVGSTGSPVFPMEGFDFDGKKVWELDISRWHVWRETMAPNKNFAAFTELSACPKPLAVENCDSEPEGYIFNVASGTVLYHSTKFARFHPEFTSDGKYMLGQFGFGDSDEGGGEYSPSTGTCLLEVDTGREIWCREEIVKERDALLSEAGGLIVGEKAIYEFYSGKRILTFPQFSEKGDSAFKPQTPGNAVTIRAMSSDGRYFVATEGKCDKEKVKGHDRENGCHLTALKDTETYLGEWDKGVVRRKLLTFEEGVQDINMRPFSFLPNGLLVVLNPYQQQLRLLTMKGETIATIVHEKVSDLPYYSLWFLQPEVDFDNKVIIWPSRNKGEWSVYDFAGKLIGRFAWKEPHGHKFTIRDFKMISDKEYVFVVDVQMKAERKSAQEWVLEVYRGKFAPTENGK